MKIGARYLPGGNTSFSVWAPRRRSMTLHIVSPHEQKINMEKSEDGYFSASVAVRPGARYFFMPDGEKDVPDPASRFQPDSVHGPSEVIDDMFDWTDDAWKGVPFRDLVLYELHVGTFTPEGTFDAVIGKLDHLLDTGINAIEIMPVAQFPGSRNWGYDGVFPFAVQNSYGGPAALKRLVDTCHAKGIAVILDVVHNHLGPEGNYLAEYGPYFSDRYKTPWGSAINFDGPWSDGVREYFTENALYWFRDFHFDGLRFDAIHGIFDVGAVHYWQLLHAKIRELEHQTSRFYYTIAESDFNDPKVIQSPELGGYGFTAQWLDDFHHAIYTLVDREEGKKLYADFGRITQLAKAYKDGFVHSGEYVQFRKRKFGRSSAGISGDHFIVFIDNHDQAGNRATGNCISSLISWPLLKVAAAGYLLSPYIPMLFMGEEFGDDSPFLYFISHGDRELVDLVRKGRADEFAHLSWASEPPDPDSPDTFDTSKLQWDKLLANRNKLVHAWYKELLQLRRNQPAFSSFSKDDVWSNASGHLVELMRRSADQKYYAVVAMNFSETANEVFTLPVFASTWKKLLDSNDVQWSEHPAGANVPHGTSAQIQSPGSCKASTQITVPPASIVVYASV